MVRTFISLARQQGSRIRLLGARICATAAAAGARFSLSARAHDTRQEVSTSRQAELLDVALEALNIARDNKALVVARDGIIIDINQRALDLCGHPSGELVGKNVMVALFESPSFFCRILPPLVGPRTALPAEWGVAKGGPRSGERLVKVKPVRGRRAGRVRGRRVRAPS